MPNRQSSGTEAFGGGYGIIRPDETLNPAHIDLYWHHVKETLHNVFNADPDLADEARNRLANVPDAQVIFYHASPLEVAADLSGYKGRQLTVEQKIQYQELLENWGILTDRPSGDDVHAMHPED